MFPPKKLPCLPGDLKTNSVNNALHSTSTFAADFVAVEIEKGEPGREVWIRVKQNVTRKNFTR